VIGIIIGSYVAGSHDPRIVLGASMAGVIALGVSGTASAYLTESAEREKEIKELEKYMLVDMSDSIHKDAAKFASLFTSLINGASPVIAACIMLTPFMLALGDIISAETAFPLSLGISILEIFILGLLLGEISGKNKMVYGLKMLIVAGITMGIAYIVGSLF